MPALLVRVSGCAALVLLCTCCVAEFADDLRITAQPRVLNDDGARARVVVSATDRYGDPGTGKVHVQSSAGSLRDGLDVVLQADGTYETELTCEVRKDPSCVDDVTVWATWTSAYGTSLRKDLSVTVRTTDAFVSACAFNNRRVLEYLTGHPPAPQLAVLNTMPEVASTTRGVALWDATKSVGAVALTLPATEATLAAQNHALLAALGPSGTTGNPLEQTFTSWDGYPAVRTTFDLGFPDDLKAALERVSQALGGAATGLPSTPAGKGGPFKAELVAEQLGTAEVAVVLALTPAAGFDEQARFDLEDVAGGSALAQALDGPSEHCEIFTVEQGKKVDFLWVVDDSCSMESSQNAVAAVGSIAATRFAGAQLDFRTAGVSTGWYPPLYQGSFRAWTVNLGLMLEWFGPSAVGWGTDGSGSERGFEAVTTAFDGGVGAGFRADSEVHVIFLSDTHDQSPFSAAEMKTILGQRFPTQHVVVSGIVCPEGDVCGDEPEDAVGKYHTLIRDTGGVLGSIKVFNPLTVTPALLQQQKDTINRIAQTVVNGAGYALQHPPITPSVRVAASAVADTHCNNRDIPRSTTDGWDLDPTSGHLAFYGKCVPALGGTVVVSYKSWVRNGTVIHETTTPVYAVRAPSDDGGRGDAGQPDAGHEDAGQADAGQPDAGHEDGGPADAGDGG